MAEAIQRWEQLQGTSNAPFSSYAGFVRSYPGFPLEETLRIRAENRLAEEVVTPSEVVSFFDSHPPVTNKGRGYYALALSALGRGDAREQAAQAWRGGELSPDVEATLLAQFGGSFSESDHTQRMNALLWANDLAAAERQLAYVSPNARIALAARLAAARGQQPAISPMQDIGFVYNLARAQRTQGNMAGAVSVMANRPQADAPAFDSEAFIGEMLRAATAASASDTVRIAAKVDDVFAPGTDISTLSYRLRDDYTTLMWKGGTNALWRTGNARGAAPLFYRYGAAAQTPQTRSKGFYWAGLAASRSGYMAEANRYYEMAAQYPERFYGQLALKALGRPLPALIQQPATQPTAEQRAQFYARPLVQAVREVARDAEWRTGVRFYRAVADQAQTEAEYLLVAELARDIGRRDLGVILGESAASKGISTFNDYAYPVVPTPPVNSWTMVHAIARQESQFAQNAISHAGARGLMQLMPGTAREQAGKLGMQYMSASLIDDASYNVRLGDGYFARMLQYYGGAYPLAIAAYNAGPGNVNKWLRANGDPRTGAIDYVEWIEQIPIYETKNYVQRVIENAVVYEALNPEKAGYGGAKGVDFYLRR
jgi:soluble lytic murein transglycosylase